MNAGQFFTYIIWIKHIISRCWKRKWSLSDSSSANNMVGTVKTKIVFCTKIIASEKQLARTSLKLGRRYLKKKKTHRNTHCIRAIYSCIFCCLIVTLILKALPLCNCYWNENGIAAMDASCIWLSFGPGTSEFSLTTLSYHSWPSKHFLACHCFQANAHFNSQTHMQSFKTLLPWSFLFLEYLA